jgi:hypothetical protein
VHVQSFLSREHKRKILVVNKRDRPFEIIVPEGDESEIEFVDETTASNPTAKAALKGDRFTLNGYVVAVITLPN